MPQDLSDNYQSWIPFDSRYEERVSDTKDSLGISFKANARPRKTSQKRVYQEIKNAIINGVIGFDTRVSEDSMAKLFGVSRTPVREAIFQLVNEGLVTKKDNSHFCVRRPSETELEDMTQVRIALQNIILDRLIDNPDKDLIWKLEQNVEKSKKYLVEEDTAALNYALSDFHDILYSAAKSFWIARILNGMVDHVLLSRAIALRSQGIRRLLISDHEKITNAIKQGKKTEAKKQMRKHVLNTKKKAMEALLRDQLHAVLNDTFHD